MTQPRASVIIVSQHRPFELRNCLTALTYQTHPDFEVIIVGDAAIPRLLEDLGLTNQATFIGFETPNISKARNLGIDAASTEIVAFIDDDAIAEPLWLEHLLTPFQTSDAAAAGGFVRGRNGISFQWKAESISATGETHPLDVDKTMILQNADGRAVKTPGTNCAFRKNSLMQIGGFDENFHFYLDETDVNFRLGQAGFSTAIVPDAEVQHSYAGSARRRQNRAPRSLYNEGASKAYFLQKHAQGSDDLATFTAEQNRRILQYMVSGALEPRDISRLMRTLRDGYEDGQKRGSIPHQTTPTDTCFTTFPTQSSATHHCLYTHWRNRNRAFSEASVRASAGQNLTLFVLSYTSLFHRRWFHKNGFWVQSGGVFGKSLRTDPYVRFITMRQRVRHEMDLIRGTRFVEMSEPEYFA